MKTTENAVRDKSFAFALRIVKMAKFLETQKKEFVLSRQVLRSGTLSIINYPISQPWQNRSEHF
ncbi:MAG: four helix bundle protein [Deltaproteobacteria bacterium]|nr:four helix bundle protein [Deltaproteobacteria bacterium]MBM4297513.1 four helix bundle protein [Deltaproteobacteria bacterium]